MAFHVGQKVVCVDDRPCLLRAVPFPTCYSSMDGLTRNQVYTIRDLRDYRGLTLIYLCEIRRSSAVEAFFGEIGYDPLRFRPVVEPKTDISIFTAMLTPKKATVSA